MKTAKILFFVALFTPWISRAEASPMKFQETVLVAETQKFSEERISLPLTINGNNLTNQKSSFLIAQVKRFPGFINRNPSSVPGAVNVKRFPDNTGVKQVILSKQVLNSVTKAGDSFFLNFTKNTLFNNPFTPSELGQIAVDTNTLLATGFQEPLTDSITLTFDGTTTSYETLDAANAAVFDIISTTGLTDGPVLLNIYGVIVGYGIVP